MSVEITIKYKEEYVDEMRKSLRLNTSEGIRGFFIGNFMQYANKMYGIESIGVKVPDDEEELKEEEE